MNNELNEKEASPGVSDAKDPAPHEGVEIKQESVRGRDVSRMAKNIGLFFASPFIALGYVIALPFVGIYLFVKQSRAARAKKNVGE